jgi:hypothetical protein
MWVKLILLVLLCLMIAGAVHFAEPRQVEGTRSSSESSASLRLLTWNMEIEQLCNRVGIIHEGRLLYEGGPDALVAPTSLYKIRVDDL